MIINTVTNDLYDGEKGINVVPVFYKRQYIEWQDRGESSGAPVHIYEAGDGIVDPWVFAKFYHGCTGTSGNGGWHIRHWMVNFQLAVELEGGRGSVIGDISPLPTTVSEGYRFK